jgi:polyferredoxin
MFRKIRIGLALLFSVAITLLFLDITGTLHTYLGWLAKIQFWPAVLALNVGVLILLIGLTLIMGRVYCSVICPLGILQDFFSWIGGKVKKNRFSFSSEKRIVRYVILTLFVILTIIEFNTIALYIEPYSAYGRIVNGLLQPLYVGINNLLATTAERMNSYAFY